MYRPNFRLECPHLIILFLRTVTNNRFLKRNNPTKTWKIFGKLAVPVDRESTTEHTASSSTTSSSASSPSGSPSTSRTSSSGVLKKKKEAASTTALIFENRPLHLPPKSASEEIKHRQQYEEMIAFAKRKAVKDNESEKKKLKNRQKLENQIANIVKTWKEDVIPNWHNW